MRRTLTSFLLVFAATVFSFLLFRDRSIHTPKNSRGPMKTDAPPLGGPPSSIISADAPPGADEPPLTSPPLDGKEDLTSSESILPQSPSETSAPAFLLMERDELRRRIPTLTSQYELHGAVYALARHFTLTPEEIDLLREALPNAREEKLLCTLLWALGMCEGHLPLEAIQPYLVTDERPDVRRAGIRTIGTHRDPRIGPLLTKAAESDHDPAVRGEAIFYLALQPRSTDTERRYIDSLSRETDPDVRGRWVNLLGTLKTESARQVVLNVLSSSTESNSVRREALEALALSGDASVLQSAEHDSNLPSDLRKRASELAIMLNR